MKFIVFWRKIFFLQTKIQGTIEYFCLSSFNNIDKQEAFSFFGNEIDLKEVDTINKGFSVVSKKSNRLLLLKYPTMKRSTQWLHLLEKNRLFVVASIPLILEKKWFMFKEIFNKKNISRKECLLLPLRTVSKALND